jgi:hypothetical protein
VVRRASTLVLLTFAVAALLAVSGPSLAGPGSGGTGGPSARLVPAVPTPGSLTNHPTANFSLTLNEPGSYLSGATTLLPGTSIQPTLRLNISHYQPTDFGAVVHLPPLAEIFWQPSGQLRFSYGATNVTMTGRAWQNVSFPARTFSDAEAVNVTPGALFSTQLVSVTSTLPWPTVNLTVEWAYSIQLPNGSKNISTGWSPPFSLVPDEIAFLVGTSSTTLTPGSQFMACLSGPVPGRTFSLLAETVSPVNAFVRANVTIPVGTILPYCWNATIPTSILPQGLIAQIWCFEGLNTSSASTFLLYSIPLHLISTTPSSSSSLQLLGIPVPVWLYYATLGTLGVGAVLVGYLGVRWWRHRRRVGKP